MKSSLVIGLIGGIACGKSSALAFFQSQGIDCFSADKMAHQLLEHEGPILQAIQQRFGGKVLSENGKLNRAYLRHLLISSQEFKTWLEALMHPAIQKQLIELIKSSSSPYCVLEIPLLKDPKPYGIQRILCIDCREDLQKIRLQKRGLSIEEISGLLALQIPKSKRIQMADDLIENNQALHDFQSQLKSLHQLYLKLATSS